MPEPVQYPSSASIRLGLARLPGSILTALLAPLVLAAGPNEAVASAVTLGVSIATKSMPLALLAGVATVALLRTVAPV